MSVGHPHRTPNKLAHTRESQKLLTTGGAPALMRRWNKFDFDHDIPFGCGYDVAGTTRYADQDFVRSLYDAAYAEHLVGAAIDTGLSPEDTLECCLIHEAVEKVLADSATPLDFSEIHDYATAAEHNRVREKGGTPVRYERGLEKIFKFCIGKPLKKVPHDYACASALEEPDANDRRIIKELQALGVTDAGKVSKRSTNYGLSRGPTHCSVCAHWQGSGNSALSECALVEGLVRDAFGCDRFEPKEDDHGETDSPRSAEPSEG